MAAVSAAASPPSKACLVIATVAMVYSVLLSSSLTTRAFSIPRRCAHPRMLTITQLGNHPTTRRIRTICSLSSANTLRQQSNPIRPFLPLLWHANDNVVGASRSFHTTTALFMAKKNKQTWYRADRVLASRTDMSRSQCHEYLVQKRISVNLNDTRAQPHVVKNEPPHRPPRPPVVEVYQDDVNDEEDYDEEEEYEEEEYEEEAYVDETWNETEEYKEGEYREVEYEENEYEEEDYEDDGCEEGEYDDSEHDDLKSSQSRNMGEEDEDNDDETPKSQWKVVPGPRTKIRMDTPLYIDRTHPVPMPPPLLAVYHKPKWVLSVREDKHDRPCLSQDLLPKMHPVGRLDYDSSGLLLFSSSGPLTQTLLHPKHNVSKEYVATVTGIVSETLLRQKMQQGVETRNGVHTAEVLDVHHMEESQVKPYLAAIRQALPSEYNLTSLDERGYLKVFDATALSTVRLVVREGKYRMVRRMLANCGHPVVTLVREKLGDVIMLGDLPPGQWRTLTEDEMAWAESRMPTKKPKEKYRPQRQTDEERLAEKKKKAFRRAQRLAKRDPDLEYVNRRLEEDSRRLQLKEKRREYWDRRMAMEGNTTSPTKLRPYWVKKRKHNQKEHKLHKRKKHVRRSGSG